MCLYMCNNEINMVKRLSFVLGVGFFLINMSSETIEIRPLTEFDQVYGKDPQKVDLYNKVVAKYSAIITTGCCWVL